MSIIAEARGITKTFGRSKALDDVSFRLEEHKIYGLLGRNGAGKTTLMHILTSQTFATSGAVRLFGEAPFENNRALRQLCFIKESQHYPKALRVSDVLRLSESFFPRWDREYAQALIREFELPLGRRIKQLSRGMLSAVGIIIGLASRAPLTMFDEPYLGLDAVARERFYAQLLNDYAQHPRTIVLSTHLIDEIGKLLEHVLLIHQGRLIVDETAEHLRTLAFTATGAAAKTEAFAAGRRVVHREAVGGIASLTVIGRPDADAHREAHAAGLEIGPVSLQQLFIHLTNEDELQRKAETRG